MGRIDGLSKFNEECSIANEQLELIPEMAFDKNYRAINEADHAEIRQAKFSILPLKHFSS